MKVQRMMKFFNLQIIAILLKDSEKILIDAKININRC